MKENYKIGQLYTISNNKGDTVNMTLYEINGGDLLFKLAQGKTEKYFSFKINQSQFKIALTYQ